MFFGTILVGNKLISAEIKIVIGIKNSIRDSLILIQSNVDAAREIECPTPGSTNQNTEQNHQSPTNKYR